MFYLDSNVIIDAIRGNHPNIIVSIKRHNASDIAIPSIVVAELEFGAKHSDEYGGRRRI